MSKSYCSYTGCTDGDIRLTGGSSEIEGTVEICHDQTWGMVSGLGWGEEDARVTCRQLQLPEDGDYKADCRHEATFVSGEKASVHTVHEISHATFHKSLANRWTPMLYFQATCKM